MVAQANLNTKDTYNYLVNQRAPEIKTETIYNFQQQQGKTAFDYVLGPESHLRRRKLILEKHPQVAKLLVPTKPYSLILAVLMVALNLTLAYLVKDSSWPVFLCVVYFIGGTVGHTCHCLIHDFTHWSGHPNILVNKVFAVFCNIAVGIPSALSFGIYHSDHHNYLGEDKRDPDLPTKFEIDLFRGKFAKFIFFTFQSIIYAVRPFFFQHKKMTTGEIANFLVIICTDLLIYKFLGNGALIYMLITGFLSIGAHPAAIHAIAEHHEFVEGMESYDYFGFWNFFNLNLGYHIEHHDFPTCPWYNLPKIRSTAPEFYEYLPHHTSYIKVLMKFIFDDKFNLYHRTLRVPEKKAE